MVLNLSSAFKPIDGEEIKFESFTFSGGEPHIRIAEFDSSQSVNVTHRINNFNDLGLLCIAIDALKRMGVKTLDLVLPYFPGARQDRVMVKGESLTVKVYAEIINKLDLNSITIFDPHSDVTPALLDNCRVIENHQFVQAFKNEIPSEFILISPDAGAAKKVKKLAKFLKQELVLECGKTRDLETGKLSGFTVPSDNLENKPCLIVDDICDGGGTFLGLAKALKEKSAGPLYLAISHGIFSKGTDALTDIFEKVFTTDSIKEIKSTSVVQIPFNKILKLVI